MNQPTVELAVVDLDDKYARERGRVFLPSPDSRPSHPSGVRHSLNATAMLRMRVK